MADDSTKFTEEQFPAVLANLAKHYGNAAEMARRFGIDPSNLRKAIDGKRPPCAKILRAIGATRWRVYEIPGVNSDPK